MNRNKSGQGIEGCCKSSGDRKKMSKKIGLLLAGLLVFGAVLAGCAIPSRRGMA